MNGKVKELMRCTRTEGESRILPPPPILTMQLSRVALFLDVDGTLAPIAPRPDLSRIPLETRRVLVDLRKKGVAMAALSGRPLAQVRRLLYPVELPMGASHGAQWQMNGGRSLRLTPPAPEGLVQRIEHEIAPLSGVWLERKPGALAVHWRQGPQYRLKVDTLLRQALVLAPGWRVMEGHCVHELRMTRCSKGTALRKFMKRPEFAGRWPLAVGDDRTDEDAFLAARALGGAAVRIGPAKPTAAQWALPDVASLASWLRAQLQGE